jgi:hypothetical protein
MHVIVSVLAVPHPPYCIKQRYGLDITTATNKSTSAVPLPIYLNTAFRSACSLRANRYEGGVARSVDKFEVREERGGYERERYLSTRL